MHLRSFWISSAKLSPGHRWLRMLLCPSFLLCGSVLASPQNVTVLNSDPRIVYNGTWVDQDNGGHKFAQPGASFAFQFNGTAIYYHSVRNPNGGVARISLDSLEPLDVDESSGTSNGSSPVPSVIYSQEGLNSTIQHVLNVSYVGAGSLGGAYVEFYFLQYTLPANSTGDQSSATTKPASSTKAIIGGVVGGVLGLLLFLGVLLFYRRRKLRERRRIAAREQATVPYMVQNGVDPAHISPSNKSQFTELNTSSTSSPLVDSSTTRALQPLRAFDYASIIPGETIEPPAAQTSSARSNPNTQTETVADGPGSPSIWSMSILRRGDRRHGPGTFSVASVSDPPPQYPGR